MDTVPIEEEIKAFLQALDSRLLIAIAEGEDSLSLGCKVGKKTVIIEITFG